MILRRPVACGPCYDLTAPADCKLPDRSTICMRDLDADTVVLALRRLLGRSRAEELPQDRKVVFQCRLGIRSAMAMQAFRASGWEAYHIDGGILAWVEAGLPLEPEDGVVAERSNLPGL